MIFIVIRGPAPIPIYWYWCWYWQKILATYWNIVLYLFILVCTCLEYQLYLFILVPRKLPESCPNVARKLTGSCPEVVRTLSGSCPKVALRHKHRNVHESSPRESCEFINRTILHRISVRTFLWWWRFLWSGSTFGPRDINTEMVTKIVAVRAVNLSTGPFCTEF